MRMNTTLVINPKGGSGKTTVATNLASHFAARNVPTAIMDYAKESEMPRRCTSKFAMAEGDSGAALLLPELCCLFLLD